MNDRCNNPFEADPPGFFPTLSQNDPVEELTQKVGKLIAITQLYTDKRPTYIQAILGTDAGEASGRKDRPYRWRWETQYFGAMLYHYLRGRNGKKRLSMKDVCSQWLDRWGEPMNYRSIVTSHANEELPDTLPDELAERLESAGFSYIPPEARVRRAHATKLRRR